jgi:hypothetical protein
MIDYGIDNNYNLVPFVLREAFEESELEGLLLKLVSIKFILKDPSSPPCGLPSGRTAREDLSLIKQRYLTKLLQC